VRRGTLLFFLSLAACAKESGKVDPPSAPAPKPSATPAASTTASDASPTPTASSVPCTADAGVIDIFAKKELLPAKPPERDKPMVAIVLSAPALGLRVELQQLFAPASCTTTIYARAEKLSLSCTFSPSTTTQVARRVQDRLVFEESHYEMAAPPMNREYHPPVDIPCGARLVFHPVTYRDPKWAAFGSPCTTACYDKKHACADPCITNLTDEKGEPTEAGSKCLERCEDALSKCTARCPP